MRPQLWHVPAAERCEEGGAGCSKGTGWNSCGKCGQRESGEREREWSEEAELGGNCREEREYITQRESDAWCEGWDSREWHSLAHKEPNQAVGQQWRIKYVHVENKYPAGGAEAYWCGGWDSQVTAEYGSEYKHGCGWEEDVRCPSAGDYERGEGIETIACTAIKSYDCTNFPNGT